MREVCGSSPGRAMCFFLPCDRGIGPVHKAIGPTVFLSFKAYGGQFFHYLEAKEKVFTEKLQLQLYFSLK